MDNDNNPQLGHLNFPIFIIHGITNFFSRADRNPIIEKLSVIIKTKKLVI